MRWGCAALVGCLFWSGCVRIDKQVRTERGPHLRTFEREKQLPGGLRAEITAQWPILTARVVAFDACQKETVDEFLEYQTTERSSLGAGPTMSAGISTTLAGGILLATTPLFSAEPEASLVNGVARTGPSPRQIATSWSIGALIVGVPALVVGLIQIARTGESTETVKAEQVMSLRESSCNERVVSGAFGLSASGERPWPGEVAAEGAVQWRADAWKGEGAEKIYSGEQTVELDEAGIRALHAFASCLRVGAQPVTETPAAQLQTRRDDVVGCLPLREEEMTRLRAALDGELKKRREGP
jgi:hypothetical protein